MKKIVPFLIFFPLLVLSFYLVSIEVKNKEAKKVVNNTADSNEKKDITIQSNVLPVTPQPSASVSPQNDSQINLIITFPISGTEINTSEVNVSGSTEPGASVSVNDKEVIAGKDGSFKTTIAIDEGDNYISVVAYNDLGNVAEREIVITRTVSDL